MISLSISFHSRFIIYQEKAEKPSDTSSAVISGCSIYESSVQFGEYDNYKWIDNKNNLLN